MEITYSCHVTEYVNGYATLQNRLLYLFIYESLRDLKSDFIGLRWWRGGVPLVSWQELQYKHTQTNGREDFINSGIYFPLIDFYFSFFIFLLFFFKLTSVFKSSRLFVCFCSFFVVQYFIEMNTLHQKK